MSLPLNESRVWQSASALHMGGITFKVQPAAQTKQQTGATMHLLESHSAANGHMLHSHMTSGADSLLDESRKVPCRALQRCTWPDPHAHTTSGAGSLLETSRRAPGRAMPCCTWPDLHSHTTSSADKLTDRSKRGASQGVAALYTTRPDFNVCASALAWQRELQHITWQGRFALALYD